MLFAVQFFSFRKRWFLECNAWFLAFAKGGFLNSKAQASLEFLLVLVFFAGLISLYFSSLNSFNSKAVSSFSFFKAKSNALECGFAVDSLSANTALKLSSKSFACFSDSNNSIASIIEGRKAIVRTIPKARIVQAGSGVSLEVEGSAHYK
jgi:hypothetical protein